MTERLAGACSLATNICDLARQLDLTLPGPLTEALAAKSAVGAYRPDLVDVAAETVTVAPKAVAALIERAAQSHTHRDAVAAVLGDVSDGLARRVVRQTHQAALDLVAAAAPLFADAAAIFTTAAAGLPAGYADSVRLINAGSGAVATLEAARAATGTLDALAAMRDGIATLGITAPGDRQVEAGTRYAACANTAAARRAASAHKDKGPLGRWGALIATKGVTGLHWLPIPDHGAYIAALPVEENHYETTVTNGFKGARLVEA